MTAARVWCEPGIERIGRDLDTREIAVIANPQIAHLRPRSKARSARSICRSRSIVTAVPYGMRDDRHGDAGCDHVGMPRSRESRRIAAFENPSSASGDLTPCSAAARAPGRWSPRSSAFVPSTNRGDAVLTRDWCERVPQLGLAEVAAIRRIRRVPRIVHFVGRNFQHRHAELPRNLASALPLFARIGRAASDDGEHVLCSERGDGDACEIRGVDASAEADEHGPTFTKPRGESRLELSIVGSGRFRLRLQRREGVPHSEKT